MALISIPVNPLLDEKGAFASLNSYSGDPVKPNPFENADKGRSEYGEEYKLSNSVSSKLAITAIGGIDSEFGTTTFIHDSIIYRLSRGPITNGSKLVQGTWWGYGLRLMIVIKNAQFGVQANWAAVAAAAQLGFLNAEFEIQSIGLSDSEIFSLLPEPTDLNIESYNQILEAGNKIRALRHTSDPAGVVYKPLRIEVEASAAGFVDPLDDDRHLFFAYNCIKNKTRLRDARKEAIKKKLRPELIAKFYNDLFAITDENERITGDQRDKAEAWLDV